MSLAGQTPRQNLEERPPKDVVAIGDSERKKVQMGGGRNPNTSSKAKDTLTSEFRHDNT